MTGRDLSLRRFSGYAMKRAFNQVQADLNATLAPHGLRLVTFSALCLIDENKGLKQSELAQILGVERPNMVLIVDELDSADLIVRDRSTEDRRAYELRLTEQGEKVLAAASAAAQGHDARMTAGITDDVRETLVTALWRIEANGRQRD